MRNQATLLFISVFFFAKIYSQGTDVERNIKLQANRMARAFISGDFKTFVKYNYEPMVRGGGGSEIVEERLAKVATDMKSNGMSFNGITFEEPSKIIRSGQELQATIVQHTDIKVPNGRVISTSTLIAISLDNGVNWTFVDTSNLSIEVLHKAMPNLSPSIKIPPRQPPVRYNS